MLTAHSPEVLEVRGASDETPYQPTPEEFAKSKLQRVRDLARWDLICHLLGWPALRLVGEG